MGGIAKRKLRTPAPAAVSAQCACGRVRLEIDYPAFWAWHDHSRPTQHAHGAAYATYVGVWRSRFRIVLGEKRIVRFEDKARHTTRSFCATCGTPLLFERSRSRGMVNVPRALFETRTGREPRYHIALEESPEWAYRGEPLGPLKGYSGVLWARPRKARRAGERAVPGRFTGEGGVVGFALYRMRCRVGGPSNSHGRFGVDGALSAMLRVGGPSTSFLGARSSMVTPPS